MAYLRDGSSHKTARGVGLEVTCSIDDYVKLRGELGLPVGTPIYTLGGTEAELRVRSLVAQWGKETMFDSAPKTNQASFREIVEMGEEAIGPLLRVLQEEPSWVALALDEIVEGMGDPNPVLEEDWGIITRIVDTWLEWGRERGYLQ